MKKWLLLVPLLLGLSQFSTGQAVTTLDQNCNLWGAAPATPQCGGTTSAASGTQLFFPDIRGTITNQFEVLVQGTAPGSLTVTVVGCMRGGTCSSTLASSSGTSSQILTPAVSALNVYDKYGVTVTWTGGDATTRFVVNRTGTVAKLSGSGGNGTVTNTSGNLTAGNVVIGNGTADVKVDSALSTNGSGAITDTTGGTDLTATQGTITTSNPFLNHSVTWNAGGVAFTNWLSNITCTAAATASIAAGFGTGGTQWQFKYGAANCGTPQFIMPGGTAAAPALANTVQLGTGIFFGSSNTIGVTSTGTTFFGVASTQVGVKNTIPFGFVNGDPTAAGVRTAISESASGVLAVGTSATNGDETGLLRDGNACRVTSDVTLTVNTATTVCSWSLPAVAKAWAWQCQIPWVISAGTGTNTLAVIANPSQAPTAATNGSAEIKTTNTNTATEATTAISASGATTLLTSGTITPSATVFMSSTSGTLLASATAGTFSIQMTAAGTTATAAAKAGATCQLY